MGAPRDFLSGHNFRGFVRELNPNWKGGRTITSGGYVAIYVPQHPRASNTGYVPEHVVVVERAIGHHLDKKHPVHHVDENKQHNANDNLVACENNAYHKLLHRRLRALRACGNPNAIPCGICRSYDRWSDLSVRVNRHGSKVGCHRECARIHAAIRLTHLVTSEA